MKKWCISHLRLIEAFASEEACGVSRALVNHSAAQPKQVIIGMDELQNLLIL